MGIRIRRNMSATITGSVSLDILQGSVDKQLFLGNTTQSGIDVDATSTARRLLTDADGKLILSPDSVTSSDYKVGSPDGGTNKKYLKVNSSDQLEADIVKLGGYAINLGSGNLGTGTQRVAIATDDVNIVKIMNAIEIMDDWDDGSDHCQVDIAVQTLTALKVSKDANANAVNNPIYAQLSQDGTNAVDATHPLVISGTAAANGTTNPFIVRLNIDGTNPMDATHPVAISATLGANAVNNPIFARLSVDGTNGSDGTHPLPISKDLTVNSASNPLATRPSVDGTNFMDASHPLIISATAAANAANNPVFTRISVDGTNGCDGTHPLAISKDLSVNSASNPIATRLSADGTNFNAQAYPIYAAVSKDTSANAQGNPLYVAVSKDTSVNSASNPIFARISADGTNAVDSTHPVYMGLATVGSGTQAISVNTGIMDAGTLRVCLATDGPGVSNLTSIKTAVELIDDVVVVDGATALTKLLQVGGSDGTNGQVFKVDTNGQLYCLRGYTLAGEDVANNRIDIKKVASATLAPSATTGTTVDSTEDVILASVSVAGYPNWSIWIQNTGAAALTDVRVYVSGDGTNWVEWTIKNAIETACETLAASGKGMALSVSGGSFTHVKVGATCGTSTTVSCNIVGNVN